MPANIADLIRENTTTTGTVLNIALTTVADFGRFSNVLNNNDTVYYVINSGGDKEVGIGTYKDTNTLDRTTPLVTVVSGVFDNSTPARINLTGTSVVSIAPTAVYLDNKQNTEDKGATNGYGSLDGNGQQPGLEMPDTLTKDIDADNNVISDPEIKGYYEPSNTIAIASGVLTIPYVDGAVVPVSLTENITSIVITGLPVSGKSAAIQLILTQDATGGRTIAYPAGTIWHDGTEAVIGSAANAVSIVSLQTINSGTSYYGFLLGKDFA